MCDVKSLGLELRNSGDAAAAAESRQWGQCLAKELLWSVILNITLCNILWGIALQTGLFLLCYSARLRFQQPPPASTSLIKNRSTLKSCYMCTIILVLVVCKFRSRYH